MNPSKPNGIKEPTRSVNMVQPVVRGQRTSREDWEGPQVLILAAPDTPRPSPKPEHWPCGAVTPPASAWYLGVQLPVEF